MNYLLIISIFASVISCSNYEHIYFENTDDTKELLSSFNIIDFEYEIIENLVSIEKSTSNLSKLVKLSNYYEKKLELSRAKWAIASNLNRKSSFDDNYRDIRLIKDGSYEYFDISFTENNESTSFPEVINSSLIFTRTMENLYAIISKIEPNYVLINNESIKTSLDRLDFSIKILNSRLEFAYDHPLLKIQNY